MKLYGTEDWVDLPDFWHSTKYIVHQTKMDSEIHEFAPENEGFHHEFELAAKAIIVGQTDQSVIPLFESLRIMEIMGGMREQMGVHYPGED